MAVWLVILWFCGQAWGATPAQQQAANAVCKVATADLSAGGEFAGSGILITNKAYGIVLTAAHVVRGGDHNRVRCEWWSGETAIGRVIKYRPDIDVAVVRLQSRPSVQPAALRCQPIQPGDSVLFLGYARGKDLVIREARIVGWLGQSGVASGSSIPGMSGGPVIDAAGKVIGPLWGSGGDLPNQTAFVTCRGRETVLTANY